jgi:hypothetical protein
MGRYSLSTPDMVPSSLQKVRVFCSICPAETDYNRPEKYSTENTTYNYYVSKVRIRSEHCVGYLKGRFSSLRGLRIRIDKPRDIQYASLWIASCIHIHNFAMDHEVGVAFDEVEQDQFYLDGLAALEEERAENIRQRKENERDMTEADKSRLRDQELEVARQQREVMKDVLFTELGMARD